MLLSAALLGASPSETAKTLLRRAQAEWSDQEYERAAELALRSVASSGQRGKLAVEALRLAGSAQAVLGMRGPATKTFESLLAIAPGFRLPEDSSPRIRAIFEPVRARWLIRREAELRHKLGSDLFAMQLNVEVPHTVRGGRPLPVRLHLVDPKRLAQDVLVFHRREGIKTYSRMRSRARLGRTTLHLPGMITASARPYRLQLYVEVLHDSGIALRRFAKDTHPRVVAVRAGQVAKPRPVYKRWWFWAGAAALAVTVPILVDRAMDVGPQEIVTSRVR